MKKIRKVAYVRVSTAQKAQLHSYEFQEEYWRTKLAAEPDTDFIGVYADKGISGCSMKRRPQFMTMMQDAREGKFDEIHTKSVSRFSRNTMELLQAVRELRDLGIRVVFEKENIDTLQAGGELILTIAAAIAESELQADSDRQRWSLQHRIQNGWISVGGGLYGYRMTESNDLEIVEEEAAVIRRIFQMYLNGAGSVEIAKALNADGLRTQNGKEWTAFRILETIVNEKYMGDCIMGKSVVVKGIKLDNDNGTLGQRFYIEDTHSSLRKAADSYRSSVTAVYRKYMECLKRVDMTLQTKTSWKEFTRSERQNTENTIRLAGMLYDMCKTNVVVRPNGSEKLETINTSELAKLQKLSVKLLEKVE